MDAILSQTIRSHGRKSLVDEAIEEITRHIKSGAWKVDAQLPPTDRLAEAMGMSRSPVREAIRALAYSGVLTTRQGSGTYVRSVDGINAVLAARAKVAQSHEIVAVRRGLDAVAASSAALLRTEEDLEELEDILRRRRQASERGDEREFIRLDLEFHTRLTRAAHNSVLTHIFEGLTEAIRESMDVQDHLAPNALSYDHEDQLLALRNRDVNLAAALALGILDSQEVVIRRQEP